MRPPTIIERAQNWLRFLPYRMGWKCAHNIVPTFTMQEIKACNWERISGSADCSKCGAGFVVSIAANDEELMTEGYRYAKSI